MAFTLAEYKKGKDDPRLDGVVEIYLNNAPFLNWLPILKNLGSSIKWTREKTLPTTGFRTLNNEYTASEGEIEEITESLKIAGGKITIDRALLEQEGPERLGIAQSMQVKSLARVLSYSFYKGDGTGGSFTGLQTRVQAGQIINAGGGALSLGALDDALSELEGENQKIIVGQRSMNLFKQAMRTTDVAGNIVYAPNEFGKTVPFYDGREIVWAGRDVSDNDILDFSEAALTSSIYCTSFDRGAGVSGFESRNGFRVYDEDGGKKVASDYDIEWNMNYMLLKARAAIRINNFTDTSFTK